MTLPRPATVLVADDSATVRALVAVELEAAGYTVVEVADGHAALDAAAAQDVDVVLLDVEMPGLDGWATVTALKADPRTADVPVVFLTGRADSADAVEALRLGAHDYLRKPPEAAELLARVAGAARIKALQDDLKARADELDRMSRTDALTGLPNRRHLQEHLTTTLSAGVRHEHSAAVLVLDVDHFKQVNDRYGHAVGDRVLQEVAERLERAVRTEDVVGRWGGEEFLVVAGWTDVEQARVLAERLRACVQEPPMDPPVTVSVGGAAGPHCDPDRLFSDADARLYEAKQGGRDRVVVGPCQPRPAVPPAVAPAAAARVTPEDAG